MMEVMAIEAEMEVTAWTGVTRTVVLPSVVVKGDSNIHTGPHSPNGAEPRPMWAPSPSPLLLSVSHLYICFLVPACFFQPLRSLQDGRAFLSTRPRTGVIMAATTAALLPDVSKAAANLVLAVLCIHRSNYIICGFNFEPIFWSFYSNVMVCSHCRRPQPEYIPPSMAIVVIAEIIPINLCLKRH